jgi:hypothetical protein
MGLLDELKQQADSLAKAHADDAARARDIAQRADQALGKLYAYLDDFGKQLAVIKPPSPRVFALSGVGRFENLKLSEFFADYRKKLVDDHEYLDFVLFQYQYTSPKVFELVKDNIMQKEQVEQYLWEANMKFSVDEFRNERGRVTGGKFTVPGTIGAVIRAEGKTDAAEILFTLRNIERFETLKVSFPAEAIDDALMEELGKLILGRPNRFAVRGSLAL